MEPTEVKNRASKISCTLTGVEVTPVNKDILLETFEQYLLSGKTRIIVGHNLHSAYLYHTDTDFRWVYDQADVVLADGKPVEVDARRSLKRDHNAVAKCERLGSTDWLEDALGRTRPVKIAVVGASADSNSLFCQWVHDRLPDSTVLGLPGSNWDDEKSVVTTQMLCNFNADITLIGLGMPRQEYFLKRSLKQLPQSIYVLVGGAIDQLSGSQINAPRWMGKYGLEWAWRLASQPRRLSYRYLIEPWKLLTVRVLNRGIERPLSN